DAFRHAYLHYYNDYDWFVKADDDTYFIMENLRYWLHDKDPEVPYYYGCHFDVIVPQVCVGMIHPEPRRLQAFVDAGQDNQTLAYSQGLKMSRWDTSWRQQESDLGIREMKRDAQVLPFIPSDVVVPKMKNLDYWYWRTSLTITSR
ncbi:putative glycoprotein-N-acetylgalactosamine 3-beta-galactosyltransferase 1, partial [Penaeus vannamei]